MPLSTFPAHNPGAMDKSRDRWSRVHHTLAEKPFLIDYASFVAQHNATYVEFYIQMSYDRLSFVRAGKYFCAVYEIDFNIEDAEGNLLQGQSAQDSVKVEKYDETTANHNYRVALLNFCVRPGDYHLRAMITDRETGKTYEVRGKFSARNFSSADLTVSDLQFSRDIHLDSSASSFVKHNRYIEPNVMRLYGQFASHLFVYYEVYNLAAATTAVDSFRTLFIIRNVNGDEIKQLWKTTRKPGTSCVQSIVLPMADLKSGAYTLTVRVFDNHSGYYAEQANRFDVQWDIFSLQERKFEDLVAQLRYIASRDELKLLENLPQTDRQRGLAEFWQRRDPTPGTPQNEMMNEYYRRLGYAKAHFQWEGGEGWKSPQGKVYVTYGPPDAIQRLTQTEVEGNVMQPYGPPNATRQNLYRSTLARRPASLQNTPYEIWEYAQSNRRFVFADWRGAGIYELIEPAFLSGAGIH